MRLIIDGYNLIAKRSGLSDKLEAQRNQLLRELSVYQRVKGYPVTVVFDGWQSGEDYEHEEYREGVSVIFSRKGERADAVIGRLAGEIREGCVVVTSDREVQRSAQAEGATAIFSSEFLARLREAQSAVLPGGGGPQGQEAERGPEEGWSPSRQKRGNHHRRSKTERKRQARLKKL